MELPENGRWSLPEDWDNFENVLLAELAALKATPREVREVIRLTKGHTFLCWNVGDLARRKLEGIRELVAYQKAAYYFNNPTGRCRYPCNCCRSKK